MGLGGSVPVRSLSQWHARLSNLELPALVRLAAGLGSASLRERSLSGLAQSLPRAQEAASELRTAVSHQRGLDPAAKAVALEHLDTVNGQLLLGDLPRLGAKLRVAQTALTAFEKAFQAGGGQLGPRRS